jgi:hypothetical protein
VTREILVPIDDHAVAPASRTARAGATRCLTPPDTDRDFRRANTLLCRPCTTA